MPQRDQNINATINIFVNPIPGLAEKLDSILAKLGIIAMKEGEIMVDLTALKDKVAGIAGVEASTKEVVVQIVSLVAAQTVKIQQLIDAGTVDPVELQAAVDSLSATTDALIADKQAIADSVAATPVP